MSTEQPGQSSSPVTEVTFALTDPSYPFVRIASEEECLVDLTEILPRGEGRYAEFFRIDGVPSDRVLSLAADGESIDICHVGGDGNANLYEFVVGDHCPAVHLAEVGTRPRIVRGTESGGRIVTEVPDDRDPTAVVEAFLEAHPTADLVAKRQKETITPPFGLDDASESLRDRLTDRQFAVLETAYDAGYYDWPRECTGKDVASDLDIASATFSQHIHVAERKLLESLFENHDRD